MRLCIYLFTICFVSSSLFGCKQTTQPHATQRTALIGSTPSLEHPAVGALQRDGINFCTGTLIAPRVVLTAGHCIDSARIYARVNNQIAFRIDKPDTPSPGGFTSHYFEAIPSLLETHPRWLPADVTQGYDVGLLILRRAVPDTIAAPIPYNAKPLGGEWQGKEVLFLGYGLIESNPYAVSPNRKQALRLSISRLEANRIRVGAPGQSLCHGDSGGPALAEIDGAWRVIAVNSFGDAGRVNGSAPARSRCDRNAYCFRTDLWQVYLSQWVERFTHESGAPCDETKPETCGTCGRCDATTKQCTPKITPASTRPQCQTCTNDADCGTGGLCVQMALGWRCATPCRASNTNNDICCPNGTICAPAMTATSSTAACMPTQGVCPEPTCQTDADCGAKRTCNNGTCTDNTDAAKPKLCFPCTQASDCEKWGLICEPLVMGGRCLQECTDNNCPQGFLCRQAHPGGKKRCMPIADQCRISCLQTSDCPQGDECRNAVCKTIKPAKAGESCANRLCESGYTCTTTITGRRCFKPCHVVVGEPNGACKDARSCAPKTKCTPVRGIKSKFCLPTCADSADCPNGGTCKGGVCVCRQTSECKPDAICETSFGGDTGFCVKQSAIRPCGTGETCRFFLEGSFCVAEQPMADRRRVAGQTCDRRDDCHRGLQCAEIRNQANLCVVSCTTRNDCFAGGQCIQGNCLCQDDLECPKGRRCQLFLNAGNTKYGICGLPKNGGEVTCVADGECGPGWMCDVGKCIIDNRPKPEPSEEPSPEPVQDTARDAGPQDDSTSDTTAQETQETPKETLPETRPETSNLDNGTNNNEIADVTGTIPSGGCGCNATANGLPLSWLLALLIIGVMLRRRSSHT